MTKFIVKPIQQLTSATKELSKGKFQTQVKTNRRDELGNLAISFNEMAKDLGQLEAMRQQFVSNVSHEIQSPLTSIRGFARALKDNVVKDEKERENYLSIIETESKRLSIMSQNLLRLATLDTDQPPHHPRSYRLDEQVRRVVVSHEPQWAEKEQEVELILTNATIIADEDQLEQVWTNLLTNSIRYTPNNGKITITLTLSEKETTVTIEDSGIGISENNQKRIFERFYKVDASRTRSEGGNGLGLAIVQRIVLLHGGIITVESVEGQGSKFSVTIPRILII